MKGVVLSKGAPCQNDFVVILQYSNGPTFGPQRLQIKKKMRRRSSRDQSDNCWVLVFLANNLQRWERDDEEEEMMRRKVLGSG